MLIIIMALIPTIIAMAEENVYSGQVATVVTKLTSVGFDGELETTTIHTMNFSVGGWEDYWQWLREDAVGNSVRQNVIDASERTLEPLTEEDYEWVSYYIDTENVTTHTKIPPSAKSMIVSTEPKKSKGLYGDKLIIDGVEYTQDLITGEVLYLNQFRKALCFSLTIDGIVYDKCLLAQDSDRKLIQVPKTAKSIVVEYIPVDIYEGAEIPHPENKIVFCIKGKQADYQNIAPTWKSDAKGWRLENADGTYLTNQWYQFNGLWYYMGADGYMLTNTTTPDGYTVNADGVWVQ